MNLGDKKLHECAKCHGFSVSKDCPKCEGGFKPAQKRTESPAIERKSVLTPSMPKNEPANEIKPLRFTIMGNPIGKPRQTRSDKWNKRPCVMRYRAWADGARAAAGDVPQHATTVNCVAYLQMPASWSKKKKEAMKGKPHRQKPDIDNVWKCLGDALFSEDSAIYDGRSRKFWDDGKGARLEVEIY